jgi:peptide/nickel transport system ATP-binding protein
MSLLTLSDVKTVYASGGKSLRAVDGVSFEIRKGETVGLVGESGCGKSTLGRTIMRLVDPSAGRITFDGVDLTKLNDRSLKTYRRRMQMVFQDPFGSLNPRHSIRETLLGPLEVHRTGDRAARMARVREVLDWVGLPRDSLDRWPHEFSGGQRQRIGIARALVLAPELIICDEPVSALDLSIQAQILNLLATMKRDLDLSYLFISHDLSVVRYFADRVLVMYLGRIVESGTSEQIWTHPAHPYTRILLDALPDPTRRHYAVPRVGELPSARDVPPGCRFHTRCPIATDLCREKDPALRELARDHSAACHYADGLPKAGDGRQDVTTNADRPFV